MNLQEKLNRYKASFVKKAPPEALAVMQRATADLQRSGMVARARQAGDAAPRFTLENQDGKAISLSSILIKGPVVLGFYRGRW